MYMFQDKNEVEIPITCKICLAKLNFKISLDEYKEVKKFPIEKEYVHGMPSHKLIVFINKNLEIETFRIEEVEQKEVKFSEELTRQVLGDIGLTDAEVELYFITTGRDAVSLGEMSLLTKNKSKEECQRIANKFVEKGLYKEIIGATPHYTALPPYAALVSQLQKFHEYISTIKNTAPKELIASFALLESKADGMKQLHDYSDFIINIKNNMISQMSSQKKDFDNIISAIDQIKGILSVIQNLDKDTKVMVDSQIKGLTAQFTEINTKISQSMKGQMEDLNSQFSGINTKISQLLAKQIDDLATQFNDTKTKISENLGKLRLGVIQQTVDQVIEKVFAVRLKEIIENMNKHLIIIQKVSKDGLANTTMSLNKQINDVQKVSTDGLNKTTDAFNKDFIPKLKTSIEGTISKINEITNTTVKSGESVKQIFADVSKNFSKAVIMAEENLSGISDKVLQSVGSLREIFSTKVIATLTEVLENILKRLEVSEITTGEFWEKAKTTSLFTMKDIWFIRSIEGAKAHLKEQITKAKMRILIVAPQISDVDLESVKVLPTKINIRIAASIDLTIPEHVAMLEELDKMTNVTYRHRELQNLWGINRDYEEVILCVISKTEIRGQMITEIAGIGSIIEEHIKIFVPVLEEAWVGAHKDIMHALPKGVSKAAAPQPSKAKSVQPATQKVVEPTISKVSLPEPTKPPLMKPLIEQPIKKPSVKELLKSTPIPEPSALNSTPQPKEREMTPLKEPSFKETAPLLEPEPQKGPLKAAPSPKQPQTIATSSSIAPKSVASGTIDEFTNFFATIKQQLETKTAIEISQILSKLHEYILNTQGYSGVLDNINKAILDLKENSGMLNRSDRNELEKKLSFWKKKLKL